MLGFEVFDISGLFWLRGQDLAYTEQQRYEWVRILSLAVASQVTE